MYENYNYAKTRLSIEEIRKHKEFEHLTDEELDKIADSIFDLAIEALKVTSQQNEKN